MSSNIQVQRICKQCGNKFTARTTVTQYCGDACSKRAYKERIRLSKIEASNKETQIVRKQSIEELKVKEFLTVTQVSILIGCSRQNVYKLINSGKLRATNLLLKKTIVKRSDLDKLFEQSIRSTPQPEQKQFDISECYTITEVQNKFGISDKALHTIIKRNNIPKRKKGWYTYVPKTMIDKLLG